MAYDPTGMDAELEIVRAGWRIKRVVAEIERTRLLAVAARLRLDRRTRELQAEADERPAELKGPAGS